MTTNGDARGSAPLASIGPFVVKGTKPALWLAVVLASVTGCGTDQPAPKSVEPLVGAWRSKVQFKDGDFASVKNLELMYSFNAGGTMTESSNYDDAPPVPPAYGIWRSTGNNSFEARYEFYSTKSPSRFEEIAKGSGWQPAGWGVLKEKFKVSSDGKSFESDMTFDLFDAAGKPIRGGGHAVGHGSKMGF